MGEPLDLEPIKARHAEALRQRVNVAMVDHSGFSSEWGIAIGTYGERLVKDDVPALIAEIERLRGAERDTEESE